MPELARTVLINARDLGRGWKTTQREYKPRWKVKRPLLDPGIEEDGKSCSTTRLIGVPDGVKTDTASHLLTFEDNAGRVYVVVAAAVFPHDENARARAEAYAKDVHGCAGHMRSVMKGWAMVPAFASRVRTEAHPLALPVDGFALRTITHTGAKSFFNYRDVVIQRGRVVTGMSMHGVGTAPDRVDISALSLLLSDRAEQAAMSLRPSRIQIPVYSPVRRMNEVAAAALTKIRDYPTRWRDRRFEEYGPDSGTAVLPGSLLYDMDNLWPTQGMIGRGAIPSLHVGWSHYIAHYVAVYRTAREARAAAAHALERSTAPTERPRRRGAVASRIVDGQPLGRGVFAQVRIKTWRMSATKKHPAMDVTSTDTVAVIRRGRMVATYACAAKGEDVKTAERLLQMVVQKLERAESKLGK